MSGLKRFIQEAHRRSIWQVLAIYAGASWLVFQIVQTLTEGLGLPDSLPALALVLLLIGAPIVVATAFVQEEAGSLAPEGEPPSSAQLEDSAAEPQSGWEQGRSLRRMLTWRNALLAGMAGLALWGVVAAGWLVLAGATSSGGDAEPASPTIAVLPFENNSDDPEVDPLVNGIHDDLLTHLFQIGGLRVISRTSVAGYASTSKTIPEIARELGATVVLEGGVQLAGDQMRINAQLIDAGTDEHLWAESYDREYSVDGILAVQSDVAGRIADALKLSLTPSGRRAIRERPTEDTEAYEHYLRGLGLLGQSAATEDVSLYPAFERELQHAVELDPGFALAHAWLSVTHSAFWFWAGDRAGTRLEDARRHAERAIQLAPQRWESHHAMSFALLNDGDRDGALEHAQEAVGLEPEATSALLVLGLVHRDRAEFDVAFGAFRQASDLDPRSVLTADYAFGTALYTRQWEEAERYLERMRDLPLAERPRLRHLVYYPILVAIARDGDIPAAREILARAREDLGLSPAEVAIVLSSAPALIGDGAFDEVLSTVGPEAADSARRCDCWQARAVWEEENGRPERAREIWAAWAADREETGYLDQPAEIQGPRRSFQAFLLARAGRPDAARRELDRAWSLDVSPLSRMSMRSYRLAMRASLGDIEGLLEDLEWLLSRPSVVTPNELRTDPVLDPYRDDPRVRELLERYSDREQAS